jgi:hypothetical protein
MVMNLDKIENIILKGTKEGHLRHIPRQNIKIERSGHIRPREGVNVLLFTRLFDFHRRQINSFK